MDAYVIDAVRTPRGRGKPGKGALSGVHPQEIAAQTLRAIVDRTGLDPAEVDDVVLGTVTQVREQGGNIARQAVLAADWPITVPATTVTRVCGSGLQAITFAAMGIMSGVQEAVVAGGVESMSRVPMGSDEAGKDGGNLRLRERIWQVPQGISADLIATLEQFSRQDVDAFALRSQQNAARAIADKRFARSLVPVVDPFGCVLLDREEFPRPTTAAGLAALPGAFESVGSSSDGPGGESMDEIAMLKYPEARRIQHVHTAGNSSGIADGAAAVLITSADFARARGFAPRARIRAMAVAADDPVIMLTAPTPASRKALITAGMSVRDIDLWEINEAFAAVPLKTIRDLDLDAERVNVNGGAIALGHPLGATGAILIGTALDELERRGAATALVTLCIAGGQGIAAIIERV